MLSSPSVMLRPRSPLLVLLALSLFGLGAGVLASCSDPVEDDVGRACRVIVGCGVDISVGDCIDLLGGEPSDCAYCIANSMCEEYSSCQRADVGCRIPPQLLPE